jgi:hypothetical protein
MQRAESSVEFVTVWGKAISDLRRNRGRIVAMHEACCLQPSQAMGQYFGRDACNEAPDFAEPRWSISPKNPENVRNPFSPYETQHMVGRTPGWQR